MANKISTQDRTALLRMASGLPVGDRYRRAILHGLKTAAPDEATLRAKYPFLDWGKVTPAAMEHLGRGKKFPEKKDPKTTPPKKEVTSQERALLKENRKRQRQLKQRMKEIDEAGAWKSRSSVQGKRDRAEKRRIDGWQYRLKKEVDLIKKPPTPAASNRAYVKYNESVDRYIAALTNPKKTSTQLDQQLHGILNGASLGGVQQAESLLSAMGAGGVAAEIQAFYDAAEKTVSDLAETQKVEETERKERTEAKKARPLVSPKPSSDPLGFWGEMPRGIQGIANVSTQRLDAVAKDLMDAAAFGASDEGEMQRLQKLDGLGLFTGNLTRKERAKLNSLVKKSKPKEALAHLGRILDRAHTVQKYLQKLKGRSFKWDEWVGRQYISHDVTNALYRLAKDQPAVYQALGADLGLKFPSARTLQKPKFKAPHSAFDVPKRPKVRRKPRWYEGI